MRIKGGQTIYFTPSTLGVLWMLEAIRSIPAEVVYGIFDTY